MYILISMLILLAVPFHIFGVITVDKKITSRTVKVASRYKAVKTDHLKEQFTVKNKEKYVLVPKKLIGEKLARYFTETSAAVIAMSCCPQIQVHRRCLRDMFHAEEHQCSDQCPGCSKKVDQHTFAQSRSNYILAQHRNKQCGVCSGCLNKIK